jgi:elongator complex protein 3
MSFYSEIIDLIFSNKIKSKEELHKYKVKLCKKYNFKQVPPDSEILARLPSEFFEIDRDEVIDLLRKKPIRTISGVAIVAVMTSPDICPHGKCLPCPGGPQNNTPQSYTGYEPATMRAILNDFNPFLQTKTRLEQLKNIGHTTDKIDLIIMGGTFTSRIPFYQEWFVKRCYDALNEEESINFEQAKLRNETASSRCIGLTVETRPDWFRLQHADQVLKLGATRVELGIQTIFDDVLYKMNRGHTVFDSISATRIAKNCGFKVCYHMMPGLPGSNFNNDIKSFKTIFEDKNFKPDMIKIYPTLTIKGAELYSLWKKHEYKPLSNDEAVELISKIKSFVPEWVRIQRIQRDIPALYIDDGVDKSNLRQLIGLNMKKHNLRCRCIRCREIGHQLLKEKIEINKEDLVIEFKNYEASGGDEIFISLLDRINDLIIAYLRLRDLNHSHRYELIKKPCMIIRELKVLGRELSIGKKIKNSWQHSGYGKELLKEAEIICLEEFNKKYLYVLSGIGVKEYYRKFGYQDDGLYLYKKLNLKK